ncbi:amino acid ABC transporter permease [Ottowia thiooxydans]|uniref:amino acid ABC transporter permease n=1 Tax=Ottowia thiooxydans TaxID=219182 RepID=UPI0004011B78|nr:amino acid ABC transporter permease [Ottowia thiooxydans]
MSAPKAFIAARPAPRRSAGILHRLRTNFGASPASLLATCLLAVLGIWALWHAAEWAVLNAVFAPDEQACEAARGQGACWGVITEKYRVILFGHYPYAEHWRAALASVLLLALVVASGVRQLWRKWLLPAWIVGLAGFMALMGGGVAGLSRVDTSQWGGLPLTLLLTTVSLALAFPLAVAVALGRRSALPAVRAVCTVYVELVRGVPLISVLFMASFMFPLLLPTGYNPDVLIRVVIGITLFAAAYMAEVVRGGLQAVSAGQQEAAASLGLGFWRTQGLVVLPQALTTVLPGLMNNFIALLKDTSLVTIVSLYELTGALGLALSGDPVWRPYKIEGYLFITMIYFTLCFCMSLYARRLEARLHRHTT